MLSLRDMVQFWTPYMSCFFGHKLEAYSVRPQKQLYFSHRQWDIIGHQLGATMIDRQRNYISLNNIDITGHQFGANNDRPTTQLHFCHRYCALLVTNLEPTMLDIQNISHRYCDIFGHQLEADNDSLTTQLHVIHQ